MQTCAVVSESALVQIEVFHGRKGGRREEIGKIHRVFFKGGGSCHGEIRSSIIAIHSYKKDVFEWARENTCKVMND